MFILPMGLRMEWRVRPISWHGETALLVRTQAGHEVPCENDVIPAIEAVPDLVKALSDLVHECTAYQGPELREDEVWGPLMEAANQALLRAGVTEQKHGHHAH